MVRFIVSSKLNREECVGIRCIKVNKIKSFDLRVSKKEEKKRREDRKKIRHERKEIKYKKRKKEKRMRRERLERRIIALKLEQKKVNLIWNYAIKLERAEYNFLEKMNELKKRREVEIGRKGGKDAGGREGGKEVGGEREVEGREGQ